MLYDKYLYPTLHSVACASHSSTSILPPPRLAPTSLFSCSVSLLLIIFTSWLHYLDSTSKWYHTVFVILWLISLSIMTSRAIHVAANGKISFFLWLSNIPFYIYAPHLYPIFFPWMLRLLPYVGKQCCFEHWGACVFSSQGFCFFRYICSSGIAGSHGGFLIFCFVFLFFWEASILFPMMAAPIHFFFFFSYNQNGFTFWNWDPCPSQVKREVPCWCTGSNLSPVERRDSPGNWQLSNRRGAGSFQATSLAVKKQNQAALGNGGTEVGAGQAAVDCTLTT